MDEIKVFDEKEETENEGKEKSLKNSSSDKKNIFIIIGAFILILAVVLGSFSLFSKEDKTPTGGTIILNVDDLHRLNREGDLDETRGYFYNGYSFVLYEGLWWTEIDNPGSLVKAPLHFGPRDLESVEVTGSLSWEFNEGEEIFLTINPQVTNKYYSLAVSETSFNVAKGMKRIPVGVCTEEHPACEGRTIISCENNPKNKPVIEFVLAEGPAIELSGTCIKIKGNNEYDIVKAADRLLYQWYRVMA